MNVFGLDHSIRIQGLECPTFESTCFGHSKSLYEIFGADCSYQGEQYSGGEMKDILVLQIQFFSSVCCALRVNEELLLHLSSVTKLHQFLE